MSTKVVFRTALLLEAVRAAAKIAPTKAGAAFDQSAGIVIEINLDQDDPTKAEALIRATDTTTYFSKWVSISSIEGGEATWRLPSTQFSQVIEKLRDASGGSVTLKQTGTQLDVTSGQTRARFAMMRVEDYPNWNLLPIESFQEVSGLGPAVRSVMWAGEPSSVEWFSGVAVLSDCVVATNRYRIARVPVKIEGLDENGIVLPPSAVKAVAEMKGDVKFYTDTMNAWLMPDDDTQIKTVLFGDKTRIPSHVFDTPYTDSITFESADVVSLVDLTGVINEGERGLTKLRMWIGKGEVAAMAVNEEIGQLRDIVGLPNQADHPRVEIHIDPKNFSSAITNGDGTRVTLHYNAAMKYFDLPSGESTVKRVLRFTKDNGYEAWVIPTTG